MYRFKIVDNYVLITDTHFGRKFKDGIPLERRGEYEESIYQSFETCLRLDMPNIVHLGDLFDSYDVGPDVLYKVANIIYTVAFYQPHKNFYFIAGNHDLHKDTTRLSSFHILKYMLSCLDNLFIIIDSPWRNGKDLFVPYKCQPEKVNFRYIFGHFDKDDIPEGDVYSGHYHYPEVYKNCTYIGSLKPLSFGEESDKSEMMTITLDEWNEDKLSLENKRVRILLKNGEKLPENDKNCLQLVGKKLEASAESKNIDVDFENFDLKKLFLECVGEELWLEFCSLKAKEND